MRRKCARGSDSVSSRGAQRRRALRISLGCGAQAGAAGSRGSAMNARLKSDETRCQDRIAALDWRKLTSELDDQGSALIEHLLEPDECRSLAALYSQDARFRSRVVMSRHGFGRGEYKYFAYPLPDTVSQLRTALYPYLAPIANRWNESLGIAVRYPLQHAEFLARCAQASAVFAAVIATPSELSFTTRHKSRPPQFAASARAAREVPGGTAGPRAAAGPRPAAGPDRGQAPCQQQAPTGGRPPTSCCS